MLVDLEDDVLIAEVIERAKDHDRWMDQVAHAGYCHHPVRLRGGVRQIDKTTGEIREIYSTEDQPDQTLLKGCGNRRESRCPSCAYFYRGDAYQLVIAGLVGGRKGIPETVACHPKLFVTLTAPSFGAVHTRKKKGQRLQYCRPRAGNPRCPHGRPLSCGQIHLEGDPRLGEPLCPECFDYSGQVLWNALCPELWRRTRIDIYRTLAPLVGMRVSQVPKVVRVSYFKVAEFQLRGAVHFHLIVRLDARPPADDPKAIVPPSPVFTAEVLAEAMRRSVERVKAPCPAIPGERPEGFIGWGKELHIRNISANDAGELTEEAVAFYIGKYATKNTEAMEGLDRSLGPQDIEALAGRPHIVRLVRTAWVLGERPSLSELNLQRWAHGLGFGGHWSTKSRRYSTTFTALRRARCEHVRRRRAPNGVVRDAWGRPEEKEAVVVLREWSYVGSGYQTNGERLLALSAAARAREGRLLAREDRYCTPRIA
jgi:hypothetical protein